MSNSGFADPSLKVGGIAEAVRASNGLWESAGGFKLFNKGILPISDQLSKMGILPISDQLSKMGILPISDQLSKMGILPISDQLSKMGILPISDQLSKMGILPRLAQDGLPAASTRRAPPMARSTRSTVTRAPLGPPNETARVHFTEVGDEADE